MDKLCATCGKQLQPEQGFCENCGSAWTPATVDTARAPDTVAAQPQPVVQQMPPPSQTSGGGKSSGTVLIVAIVVALGIGAWLFLRQRAKGDSSMMSSSSTSSSTMMTSSTPAQPASSVAPAATEGSPAGTPAAAVPASEAATAAATEAAAGSKQCSLVTRAEMENILGSKIVKVTTSDRTCSYFTDETLSADIDTVWTGGRDAFAQVKGFNAAPGLAEPVAGIGDEAYMQAAGVLHFLKGDTYVVVNSRVYPNKVETESAIGRKVIEKLK